MSATAAAIRPIETRYKGYRFRSRLEARWAVFFDTLGVRYEYETEGFDLGPDLGWHLPDFWLPEEKLWVEIKPEIPKPPPLRFYLAGGAGENGDWRDALIGEAGIASMEEGTVPLNIPGGHRYTGPFGITPKLKRQGPNKELEELELDVLGCIRRADAVFTWIDGQAPGVALLETGIAIGLGKRFYAACSLDGRDRLGGGTCWPIARYHLGRDPLQEFAIFRAELGVERSEAGRKLSRLSSLFGGSRSSRYWSSLGYMICGAPWLGECEWFLMGGALRGSEP